MYTSMRRVLLNFFQFDNNILSKLRWWTNELNVRILMVLSQCAFSRNFELSQIKFSYLYSATQLFSREPLALKTILAKSAHTEDKLYV